MSEDNFPKATIPRIVKNPAANVSHKTYQGAVWVARKSFTGPDGIFAERADSFDTSTGKRIVSSSETEQSDLGDDVYTPDSVQIRHVVLDRLQSNWNFNELADDIENNEEFIKGLNALFTIEAACKHDFGEYEHKIVGAACQEIGDFLSVANLSEMELFYDIAGFANFGQYTDGWRIIIGSAINKQMDKREEEFSDKRSKAFKGTLAIDHTISVGLGDNLRDSTQAKNSTIELSGLSSRNTELPYKQVAIRLGRDRTNQDLVTTGALDWYRVGQITLAGAELLAGNGLTSKTGIKGGQKTLAKYADKIELDDVLKKGVQDLADEPTEKAIHELLIQVNSNSQRIDNLKDRIARNSGIERLDPQQLQEYLETSLNGLKTKRTEALELLDKLQATLNTLEEGDTGYKRASQNVSDQSKLISSLDDRIDEAYIRASNPSGYRQQLRNETQILKEEQTQLLNYEKRITKQAQEQAAKIGRTPQEASIRHTSRKRQRSMSRENIYIDDKKKASLELDYLAPIGDDYNKAGQQLTKKSLQARADRIAEDTYNNLLQEEKHSALLDAIRNPHSNHISAGQQGEDVAGLASDFIDKARQKATELSYDEATKVSMNQLSQTETLDLNNNLDHHRVFFENLQIILGRTEEALEKKLTPIRKISKKKNISPTKPNQSLNVEQAHRRMIHGTTLGDFASDIVKAVSSAGIWAGNTWSALGEKLPSETIGKTTRTVGRAAAVGGTYSLATKVVHESNNNVGGLTSIEMTNRLLRLPDDQLDNFVGLRKHLGRNLLLGGGAGAAVGATVGAFTLNPAGMAIGAAAGGFVGLLGASITMLVESLRDTHTYGGYKKFRDDQSTRKTVNQTAREAAFAMGEDVGPILYKAHSIMAGTEKFELTSSSSTSSTNPGQNTTPSTAPIAPESDTVDIPDYQECTERFSFSQDHCNEYEECTRTPNTSAQECWDAYKTGPLQ